MTSKGSFHRHGMPVVVGLTLALAACAAPPPTAELRGARDSIARAQYDGAPDLATQPFQTAQDKLASARSGVSNGDMDQAKALAEESQADADYADAVSVVKKTASTASQLQGLQSRSQ
jgi:Domain of unknown function (DUF4398)